MRLTFGMIFFNRSAQIKSAIFYKYFYITSQINPCFTGSVSFKSFEVKGFELGRYYYINTIAGQAENWLFCKHLFSAGG